MRRLALRALAPLALCALAPLASGCILPGVALLGPPMHYALDKDADSFWKDKVWGAPGVCVRFHDGDSRHCD